MNFLTFPLIALMVLSDAIGRIDYEAADMEAAREAIRDAVAAAIAAQERPGLAADTNAQPSDTVSTAAQALLDAFGSDVPDWLRGEAAALEAALLHASAPPSDDDGCPVGDPDCLGNNGDCHDACESPAPVTRTVTMEELGPEAQAVVQHAIAIGADRVSISTLGPVYWRGHTQLSMAASWPSPAPRLLGQLPGETYQQAEDRRAADLMKRKG
jgi:hypothetical protein